MNHFEVHYGSNVGVISFYRFGDNSLYAPTMYGMVLFDLEWNVRYRSHGRWN